MTNRFPPLHSIHINDADNPSQALVSHDHSLRVQGADVEVVFRNLESRLIDEINQADAVFGCVAWLTHEGVLQALALKKSACIVVQKEDFLRPDSKDVSRRRTRDLYQRVPGFSRYALASTCHYSFAGSPSSEGVRCVGYSNSDPKRIAPRMHNKFLVFCRGEEISDGEHTYFRYRPYAVWTGSFNLTFNAADSVENAVLIRNDEIAAAYAEEFGSIFGLSEPLNWSSEWVAPEYRIGS